MRRPRRHHAQRRNVRVSGRLFALEGPRAADERKGISSASVSLHVVLVEPEIHWNTGNAGRTCLAAGATLHVIEPLGFSLDEKQVRRAGLDFWGHVDLRAWPGRGQV